MARGKTRRKGNVITVNFKGVEGKRPLLPEGDYIAKPIEIDRQDGQKDEYLSWTFEVTRGKSKGAKLWYNTSLAPQALWNLRGLLEAMGVEVPEDDLDIDLEEIVSEGAEVLLVVEHDTYEGKKQAKVVDFGPADEESEDDDEDDKKKSKRSKSRKDDDDEDDEDEGKSSKKSRGKSSRKSKEDDEDEDDEDEDDDKKSKSRRGGKSKKSKKVITNDDIEDMSESELEDLVEEHELDVDLGKKKTLSKKRNAIIDALEEAGLMAA
ncbi:MAG: DUF669 domain-containing protein [Phycisphaerales bacterium]